MTRLPLVLACLLATPAFAQADIDKINGSINVSASQSAGRLETVNGSIRVGASATVRSAETVNGSITVDSNARTGSLETVNGSVRVAEQVAVDGGIETVNGSVYVGRDGRVDGNVATVNGAIGLVDADLAGGIETVSGDTTVGAGSHVRGGIRYTKPTGNWNLWQKNRRKPRVIVGPNARVDGPLVFEHEVDLYVHATARTGAITGATAVRYTTDRAPVQ